MLRATMLGFDDWVMMQDPLRRPENASGRGEVVQSDAYDRVGHATLKILLT